MMDLLTLGICNLIFRVSFAGGGLGEFEFFGWEVSVWEWRRRDLLVE